jgi:hypothetical protein
VFYAEVEIDDLGENTLLSLALLRFGRSLEATYFAR